LKPKQNCIETRAITTVQIAKVIQILEEKKDAKHYYYRTKYYIVPGEIKKLAAIKPEGSKAAEDTIHRLIVSLEDMWFMLSSINEKRNAFVAHLIFRKNPSIHNFLLFLQGICMKM